MDNEERLKVLIDTLETYINKIVGELEENRQAEIKRLQNRIEELEKASRINEQICSQNLALQKFCK